MVDSDQLLSLFGRYEIFVFHPRATDFPISDGDWVTWARISELPGATESMQVWDIMRAIDYMTTGLGMDSASISLYGKGEINILALYAAIMDLRSGCVILDHPPVTNALERAAVLNILRVTDIPEAVALLAPRELVLLTSLTPEFDYTAAFYRLIGHPKQFRKTGSLPEGLEVWKQKKSKADLDAISKYR